MVDTEWHYGELQLSSRCGLKCRMRTPNHFMRMLVSLGGAGAILEPYPEATDMPVILGSTREHLPRCHKR